MELLKTGWGSGGGLALGLWGDSLPLLSLAFKRTSRHSLGVPGSNGTWAKGRKGWLQLQAGCTEQEPGRRPSTQALWRAGRDCSRFWAQILLIDWFQISTLSNWESTGQDFRYPPQRSRLSSSPPTSLLPVCLWVDCLLRVLPLDSAILSFLF